MTRVHIRSELKGGNLAHQQQELFPLDPWGVSQAFSVIDWPHEGIARAMIGPLRLADSDEPSNDSLRCLLVAADGQFAANIRVLADQLSNPCQMWSDAARGLELARRSPLQTSESPGDCVGAWTDPGTWIPRQRTGDPIHRSVRALARLMEIREMEASRGLTDEQRAAIEREALAEVTGQVAPAVSVVLASLERDILEVLLQRRGISIAVISRLLELAKGHSQSAVRYTWQAIRTEPLPLLHLAASGHPPQESKQVRQALFTGNSLPDTMTQMGVCKMAHKRSIRRPLDETSKSPAEPVQLSELAISGADWLNVMRGIKGRLLNAASDCAELGNVVLDLISLGLRDAETIRTVLSWSIAVGYPRSRQRFHLLTEAAQAIQKAARALAHIELPLEDAIALAMKKANISDSGRANHHLLREDGFIGSAEAIWTGDVGLLADLVSEISRESVAHLTGALFAAHPGLPPGLCLDEEASIEALTSLDAIVEHGAACGNCLEDERRAIQYAADGMALYAIRHRASAIGTAALRVLGGEDRAKVVVRELTGINNLDPTPGLRRSANMLASAWSSPGQVASWLAYDRACEHWRRSMD